MEARTKTVEGWFAMIRDGQITLPRFQRFEAWGHSQIVGVLENMLCQPSLPIGALLVLEVGDKELFVSRPISGVPVQKNKPQMNLLDGQQRITAIWRALTDNYEDLTVFVSLEDKDQPGIDICKRPLSKHGRRMPLWADDPAATLERKLFPISLLCPGTEGEERMHWWMEEAKTDKATDRIILNLRSRVSHYPIPFLSLSVDTEQETALNVFINMNTSASPLKDFDIVVAQIEGAMQLSLHDMIKDLKEKVPTIRDYGKAEDLALAVGALLVGKPPLKRTYLDPDFGGELAGVWGKVVSGLSRGILCLRDEAIFNERLLPTEVIVYLVSALWANVREHGADEEGHARRQIRKAIWRASFTDRYLKTATTRAFADYKALADLIDRPGSDLLPEPELFDESMNPLPNLDDLPLGGWPARKDRLGRAIIVVSLYGGGIDFADGSEATPERVRSREYHHLFPRSLIEDDFPSHMVNSALNCAYISWKTNRRIAAKSPREYVEERAKEAGASLEEVRDRLESHLVPYDELMGGDFEAFIRARSDKIHSSMKSLCDGLIP